MKHGIGTKALIADDEKDICYLLSSLLKRQSLRSVCVNSIAEVEAALHKEPFCAIFLDNNLPDGKGVDLIPSLKNNFPHLKIVMITAYDTYTDRQKAFSAGVDFFVAKPFTRNIITEVMEQLFFSYQTNSPLSSIQ